MLVHKALVLIPLLSIASVLVYQTLQNAADERRRCLAVEDAMSDADMELAAQFCPVVHFDSQEKIRPMLLEDYVAASSLHDLKTDRLLQADLSGGLQPGLERRLETYLKFRAEWRRMDGQAIDDVPFYVKVDHGVRLLDKVQPGRRSICSYRAAARICGASCAASAAA